METILRNDSVNTSDLYNQFLNMSNTTTPALGYTEAIILSTINTVISILGSVGNIMVILVIIQIASVRRGTEIFICSLALSDVIVSMIAQPMYVLSLMASASHHSLTSEDGETFRQLATWVSTLASVSGLFAVSSDRLWALLSPLKYRARVVGAETYLTVMFIWIFSLVLGVSTVFTPIARGLAMYFVIGMLILIVLIYLKIFSKVRQQSRQVIEMTSCHLRHSSSVMRSSALREHFAARTIAIVVGLFYVTWLPLSIVAFFSRYDGGETGRRLFPYVNTLALCNSGVNPYVYYWKGARFRRSIKNLILHCKP